MAEDQPYELYTETSGGTVTMAIRGRIDITNAQRLLNEMTEALTTAAREVILDLSQVGYFDSGGGAVVIGLRQRLSRRGIGFRISGTTPAIDGFLSLVDQEALLRPPPPPPAYEGLTVQLGAATLGFLADARELINFTGELIL